MVLRRLQQALSHNHHKEYTHLIESFQSMNHYSVDIFDWYKKHEETLPLLSRIASSVLTIPCQPNQNMSSLLQETLLFQKEKKIV